MRYAVVLLVDPEDGGYPALVPALPGCESEGETEDEALAMIQDAAAGYFAAAAELGEDVPEDAFGTVVTEIEVPVPVAEAVA